MAGFTVEQCPVEEKQESHVNQLIYMAKQLMSKCRNKTSANILSWPCLQQVLVSGLSDPDKRVSECILRYMYTQVFYTEKQ